MKLMLAKRHLFSQIIATSPRVLVCYLPMKALLLGVHYFTFVPRPFAWICGLLEVGTACFGPENAPERGTRNPEEALGIQTTGGERRESNQGLLGRISINLTNKFTCLTFASPNIHHSQVPSFQQAVSLHCRKEECSPFQKGLIRTCPAQDCC